MTTDNLVFQLPLSRLPVRGSSKWFPVRRIYCVGRNYVEHIKEMGGDEREPPFFFQKPSDCIVPSGSTVAYPVFTSDFQHEVELVLAIGVPGKSIAVQHAHRHVVGLGVGIDLTRRDVQIKARKTGRPWEIGKSFDFSAPCSELVQLPASGLPTSGEIELKVNGTTKQKGDLSQMIWSAAEVVSQLSEQYSLMPGDLIYTGTPAGVGPLCVGDVVTGTLADVGTVQIEIGERLA